MLPEEMTSYQFKAEKIKNMGYELGPENGGQRPIIPKHPIRFGYPEGEGFAQICVETGEITENTGDETPKKSEWYLFGESMGIGTEITSRLRADRAAELYEIRERINMRRHRRIRR